MPIKVIETGSQKEVEVSAAEAKAMLDAGAAILPAGKVRVIREGNRTGSVDAASLDQALAEGWQLADDDQIAQAKLRRDAESVAGTLQGGFESAARGVSFGATDYLARQAGVDMEAMRARQEALGGLGTAVELGGSLLTGSAIAKGVTKAGQLGARAAGVDLASGLTPAAPSLARTTAHVAGQGAVEGFAAGAGKEVSEASLGDRDLVASQVLAQGGYGALFGAGAGTLIPGIAAAGAGLARVPVRAVKSVLGKATSASDDGSTLISRVIGSDKATRDARARVWAGLAGVDDDVAMRLADDVVERPDALTRAMDEAPRVGEEIAGSLRDPMEKLRAARDKVRIEFGGAQKIRHVEKNLPKSVDKLVAATDAATAKLDEIEGKLAGASTLANASDLTTIRKMVAEARTEIGAAAANANGRTGQRAVAATAYRAVDRVKQGIFSLKSNWDRIARAPTPTREAQVMSELLGGLPGREGQSLYGSLRAHLEDEQVWEGLGRVQQEMNRASARALDARRMLKGSAGGRLLDTRTPQVDNADLLTVARQFGRFQGATKTELLEDAIAAEREYLEAASRNLDLGPSAKQAIADYRAASGGVDKAIRDKRDLVRMLDDVEHFRGRESGRSVSIGIGSNLSTLIGSGLGGAIGGLPGAVIGAAAAAAFRPYTLVRRLAAIQARMSGAGAAQTKAIGDFLERVSTGASRQIEKRSRLAGRASSDYAAKEAARKESLAQTRKRTSELLADPAHMAEQIRRMTADLEDVAPNVATAIGDNVRRTVTYLAAKQPKTYQAAWSSSPPLVDPVDEARYERCVEGALRPWEALAKLTIGAFTNEHAEALQFCHPAIFKMEQTRILEAMATAKANKKSIPLEDASQISVFFNVPADPTLALAPGIAIAMTPSAQQEAGPAPTPRGSKSEPIDSARYETPVQQIGQIK